MIVYDSFRCKVCQVDYIRGGHKDEICGHCENQTKKDVDYPNKVKLRRAESAVDRAFEDFKP